MTRPPRLLRAAAIAIFSLLALLLPGCTTGRETQPPRTATEQLLLSQAVIQSVDQLDVQSLKGHDVYLKTKYLDRIDRRFVIGQIRAVLMERGTRLMNKAKKADIIVEVRSAGLGINKREAILGIPSLPIPVPSVGTFETPEFALVKNRRQQGMEGIAILAYRREDRSLVTSSGTVIGRTLMNDWSILGLRLIRERKNLPQDLE